MLIPESLQIQNEIFGHITTIANWHFELNRCEENLLHQFNTTTLDGFGVAGFPNAIRASGAIIDYLHDTQPTALKLLSNLSVYSTSEFMNLDAATRRNLELTETIRKNEAKGSLLYVLDRTVTPMGHRMIRQWVSKPLLDISDISKRQNAVKFFIGSGILRAELLQKLRSLSDLERFNFKGYFRSCKPTRFNRHSINFTNNSGHSDFITN